MPDLIPIESINALQVFTEDGIDTLLEEIKAEVENFEPDVSTAKGRAEIKSRAYKVILSKGVIDRAGADLVKGWKAQAKVVDDSRRKARAFLDVLAIEVRQPYTEYKEETARMQAEAVHKIMIRAAYDEALAEHEIWLREKVLAEKEAKAKAEDEERQREEAQRLADEAETKRLEQIRIDAEKKAKREAAEAVQQERDRLAKVRREAAEAAEREKERVKQTEQDKIEAATLAEQEQAVAVEAERLRVIREQEDRARIAEEQADEKREVEVKRQAIEEARQANTEHRRNVNTAALKALMKHDFNKIAAKQFITVVFQEKIPGIRMVY